MVLMSAVAVVCVQLICRLVGVSARSELKAVLPPWLARLSEIECKAAQE